MPHPDRPVLESILLCSHFTPPAPDGPWQCGNVYNWVALAAMPEKPIGIYVVAVIRGFVDPLELVLVVSYLGPKANGPLEIERSKPFVVKPTKIRVAGRLAVVDLGIKLGGYGEYRFALMWGDAELGYANLCVQPA